MAATERNTYTNQEYTKRIGNLSMVAAISALPLNMVPVDHLQHRM